MKRFTTLTSIAAPLLRDNVDTDTIIPSREMRSTGKTGLAGGLFAPWRYSDVKARVLDPDFALNQTKYACAQVLLSGANFGCGSSREHAVWAIAEYGIRCIIAPSFAPIFANNCIRNGVLPIVLESSAVAAIAGREVTVDLPAQAISCGSVDWHFDIDAEGKTMLLEGLDPIDLTMKNAAKIAVWQMVDRVKRPYIYLQARNQPSDPDKRDYDGL